MLALCGPAIHQLSARAFNHGSLASLFTSRDRGTKPKIPGSGSGGTPAAGFSNLGDSRNGRTWPLITFGSVSSTTATAEGDKTNSGDWQNRPYVTVLPTAYGPPSQDRFHGSQRERDMV